MTHVGCPVSGSRCISKHGKYGCAKTKNIWADFHIWKCTLDPQHSASNAMDIATTSAVPQKILKELDAKMLIERVLNLKV
jgi:hypothetical protein